MFKIKKFKKNVLKNIYERPALKQKRPRFETSVFLHSILNAHLNEWRPIMSAPNCVANN